MSPVSTILSWRYQKCPTYAFNYYIRMSLTWHSRRRKRTRNWNIFQTFVSEQIHSVCALWEKNKCIPFETQQHLWLWVDFDVVSTHCWTHQHHHKYVQWTFYQKLVDILSLNENKIVKICLCLEIHHAYAWIDQKRERHRYIIINFLLTFSFLNQKRKEQIYHDLFNK